MVENQIEGNTTEELEAVGTSAVTVVSEEVATMLLGNIDKLDTAGPGVKLDSESYKFTKVGETVKGVFAGHLTMTFKVEDFDAKNPQYVKQDAVKWMNRNSEGKIVSYVCASKALVNKIRENGIPVGTLLEITMTDDKGGNNGKVKLFDVTVLTAKK